MLLKLYKQEGEEEVEWKEGSFLASFYSQKMSGDFDSYDSIVNEPQLFYEKILTNFKGVDFVLLIINEEKVKVAFDRMQEIIEEQPVKKEEEEAKEGKKDPESALNKPL